MTKPPFDPSSMKDTPESDLQARVPGEQFPWQKFAGEIKGMLVGTDYEYADAMLRGILETVQRTQVVTSNQRNAVANIAAKPARRRGRDYQEVDRGGFGERGKMKRRWEDQ